MSAEVKETVEDAAIVFPEELKSVILGTTHLPLTPGAELAEREDDDETRDPVPDRALEDRIHRAIGRARKSLDDDSGDHIADKDAGAGDGRISNVTHVSIPTYPWTARIGAPPRREVKPLVEPPVMLEEFEARQPGHAPRIEALRSQHLEHPGRRAAEDVEPRSAGARFLRDVGREVLRRQQDVGASVPMRSHQSQQGSLEPAARR